VFERILSAADGGGAGGGEVGEEVCEAKSDFEGVGHAEISTVGEIV